MSKQYVNNADVYDRAIKQSKVYGVGDEEFVRLVNTTVGNRNVKLYEPGCGTGLMTERLAQLPLTEIIAADPCKAYLENAKKRLNSFKNVRLFNESALTLKVEPVDIIAMRWVYHHIPDERKVDFTRIMYSNLKQGGNLLMLDEFLPYYKTEDEWKISLFMFHWNRASLAWDLGDKQTVANDMICLKNALDGIEEHKVHLGVLLDQLYDSGFTHVKTRPLGKEAHGVYLISAHKEV